MFDGLKARLDRLLRDRGGSDPRAYAAGLREALEEARLGITEMRRALAAAEQELQSERKQLADAERHCAVISSTSRSASASSSR